MSSKSLPSSALALNVNFKFGTVPDGFIYDGDNFLTWTNWITSATEQYPILVKLLDGTATRPTGAGIREKFNKQRVIEAFAADKRDPEILDHGYFRSDHMNSRNKIHPKRENPPTFPPMDPCAISVVGGHLTWS